MPRPTQTATRTTSIVKDLISSKKAGKEKYRKELIFEPEMKERLEAKASQEGLTVSAYIKRLVVKDLNT